MGFWCGLKPLYSVLAPECLQHLAFLSSLSHDLLGYCCHCLLISNPSCWCNCYFHYFPRPWLGSSAMFVYFPRINWGLDLALEIDNMPADTILIILRRSFSLSVVFVGACHLSYTMFAKQEKVIWVNGVAQFVWWCMQLMFSALYDVCRSRRTKSWLYQEPGTDPRGVTWGHMPPLDFIKKY